MRPIRKSVQRYNISLSLDPDTYNALLAYAQSQGISQVTAAARELLMVSLSTDNETAITKARKMGHLIAMRTHIFKSSADFLRKLAIEIENDAVLTME